jgi:signal transduction histidine kinase
LQPLKKDLALLEIEDDGVGFDPSAVDMSYESRGSLGMVNMRERAELVNSVLRLESTPGSGTRVQVIIPLTDQAAERMRRGN